MISKEFPSYLSIYLFDALFTSVARDSGAIWNIDSGEVDELLRIGAAACPRRRHGKMRGRSSS